MELETVVYDTMQSLNTLVSISNEPLDVAFVVKNAIDSILEVYETNQKNRRKIDVIPVADFLN